MKKVYLLLLLALPFLLVGCKNDKTPTPTPPPVQEIPDGTLPVVFHVLYEDPNSLQQSPKASVFQDRLSRLNSFYAATLYPGAGSAPVDVKFMMATVDPDGNAMAEPGINRVQYTGATNMSAVDFLDAKPTGRNAKLFWDPNKYVNVWVFGFLNTGNPNDPADETYVTGISYLAYATTAHPIDKLNAGDYYLSHLPNYMHGITLNNAWFTKEEGIPTLIHEMGHYLGLKHAFSDPSDKTYDGCANKNDASDDGCADTPKYDRRAYQSMYATLVGAGLSYARESCAGQPFRSKNVMDYYDGDRTQFTAGQGGRVESVLGYSPLIPRSSKATKTLLENFTGEITDEIPEAIKMRCGGSVRKR